MQTVNFLAQLWGFCLVIVALALLLNKRNMEAFFELVQDKALLFLAGIINIVFGIALVLSYNVWDSTWHVVITILGWLVIVRGAGILFFPEKVVKMVGKFKNNPDMLQVALGIAVVLGCFLLFMGFSY